MVRFQSTTISEEAIGLSRWRKGDFRLFLMTETFAMSIRVISSTIGYSLQVGLLLTCCGCGWHEDAAVTTPKSVPKRPAPVRSSPQLLNVDYGFMLSGEQRTKEVWIHNPSDVETGLTSIVSSCSCTVGKANWQSLKPGQSKPLLVSLNAPNRTSRLEKHVALEFSDDRRQVLQIGACVHERLECFPRRIDLEVGLNGALDGDSIELVTMLFDKGSDSELIQPVVSGLPPWIDVAEVVPINRLGTCGRCEPTKAWKVELRLKAGEIPNGLDSEYESLKLSVDSLEFENPDHLSIVVPIVFERQDIPIVYPRRITFRAGAAGEQVLAASCVVFYSRVALALATKDITVKHDFGKGVRVNLAVAGRNRFRITLTADSARELNFLYGKPKLSVRLTRGGEEIDIPVVLAP